MKSTLCIIAIFLTTIIAHSQTDQTSLWIFRMEQDANESVLYEKLQGSREGFPTSTGLLKNNDTIKYQSGHIFRVCEVVENKLNGYYRVYYPSGQLYLLSTYKDNALKDSTTIYDDKGKIESVIHYLSPTQEQQIFFDSNSKVKRIDHIKIAPTTQVTFNSGYIHTNTEKLITTEYFNPEGSKIKKKKYLELYPGEKQQKTEN